MGAVDAVHEELSRGIKASLVVVIYDSVLEEVGQEANASVVERHIVNVGSLPIVLKEHQTQEESQQQKNPLSPASPLSQDHKFSFLVSTPPFPSRGKTEPLDKDTPPDLGEQFRAVFSRLENACQRLSAPSMSWSCMISMELKDDEQSISERDSWITVQSSAGNAKQKVMVVDNTIPIYSVRYNDVRFDVYVESYSAGDDAAIVSSNDVIPSTPITGV